MLGLASRKAYMNNEFISEKYKVLKVVVNGTKILVPTINNSYLYTLWVLRHVYDSVRLFGVNTLTYVDVQDVRFMEPTDFVPDSEIFYTIPDINPNVDTDSITSIAIGLGIDAVLLLKGMVYTDIIERINKDESIPMYSRCTAYFDNHIIYLQIQAKKAYGMPAKLLGMPYYKYTNKKRNTFNKSAQRWRAFLNKESNREKKQIEAHKEETLTPAMREYYESQLHDFVHTYIYKGKTPHE